MKDFNSYLDNLDYSLVKDLFHEKGKQRIYHKKDFFIRQNEIRDFNITGADAAACVKSTCYNLCKAKYGVNVLADCITSYDKKKIDEMLHYYEDKGCRIIRLNDLLTF